MLATALIVNSYIQYVKTLICSMNHCVVLSIESIYKVYQDLSKKTQYAIFKYLLKKLKIMLITINFTFSSYYVSVLLYLFDKKLTINFTFSNYYVSVLLYLLGKKLQSTIINFNEYLVFRQLEKIFIMQIFFLF